MGRDLLYKPPVPIPLQDDDEDASKANKVKKPGASRVIGKVGDIVPSRVSRPAGADPTRANQPQAYKAAYFNKDTSGVNQMNPNTSGARALRGASDATNLRNVVLPPPLSGIETPDPGVLGSASEMMGLGQQEEFSLEGLLGRQNEFTRHAGVTAEMIEQRMAELEAMTEARKVALQRMHAQSGPSRMANSTIEHAQEVEGAGVEKSYDVAEEGTFLVQRASDQARGMHKRVAKALGFKLPDAGPPKN
ncbi:MAG: hypothetical protein AAFU77_13000 [Myxococcota bacterium]